MITSAPLTRSITLKKRFHKLAKKCSGEKLHKKQKLESCMSKSLETLVIIALTSTLITVFYFTFVVNLDLVCGIALGKINMRQSYHFISVMNMSYHSKQLILLTRIQRKFPRKFKCRNDLKLVCNISNFYSKHKVGIDRSLFWDSRRRGFLKLYNF